MGKRGEGCTNHLSLFLEGECCLIFIHLRGMFSIKQGGKDAIFSHPLSYKKGKRKKLLIL